MADSRDSHVASVLVACLVASVGLGVVMIRVPGGLSVIERVGLWLFLSGSLSASVYVKTKTWE